MTDEKERFESVDWGGTTRSLSPEELDKFMKEKVWGKRYSGSGYMQFTDTPGNRKLFAGILGISLEELDRRMYEAKSIICN